MLLRSLVCLGASALLLACGDDASTTGSAGSGESTGPVVSDTSGGPTSDEPTSTPITGDASESGASESDSTTTLPTTGLDSSTGPVDACGNGVIDDGEVCDGRDLGGQDCNTQEAGDGRGLACQADCMGFDTSRCVIDRCGSNIATSPEVCDGTDLLGQTCITQGFDSGTLACELDCSAFDTSECGTCGNVIVEGDEACDDIALLGQTCLTQGFEHGEIACAADCMGFDTNGCGLCGDGSVGGEEICDGADLNGASCMSLGLGNGNLLCLPSCFYDFADCDIPGGTEVVDFPLAADPRLVASGTNPWNAGDWFEGVRVTMFPSIGQLDIHLEIVNNVLSACGMQEAEVSINGVALGTFTVLQGTTVIDQSYPIIPSIVGPVYTIRYETTTTVAGGCGSAGYDEVGSTVTFHAG
jgi:hypothetical protein